MATAPSSKTTGGHEEVRTIRDLVGLAAQRRKILEAEGWIEGLLGSSSGQRVLFASFVSAGNVLAVCYSLSVLVVNLASSNTELEQKGHDLIAETVLLAGKNGIVVKGADKIGALKDVLAPA